MAARWGRKAKEAVGGNGKPERISNKLDHVLIAENKQRFRRWHHLDNRLKALIIVACIALVGGAAWGGYILLKEDPVVTPPPQPEDPFYGQEPEWSPIFEWKSKDQR